MSDDELIDGCKRTAKDTQFWYNDYYREIERRTQHAHSKSIRCLTIAIAVLTFVATVATIMATIIAVIE